MRYFSLFISLVFISNELLAQQDTIRSFPYFNGFEDVNSLIGWEHASGYQWERKYETANNSAPGMYFLKSDPDINSSSPLQDRMAELTSPVFEIKEKHALLSFDFRNYYTYTGYKSKLIIQVACDGNDWLTILEESGQENNNWIRYDVPLSGGITNCANPESFKIRLISDHPTSGSSYDRPVAFDNLSVSSSNWKLGESINDNYSGIASGSYSSSSYTPEKAFDGDVNTRWRNYNERSSITYDLAGCTDFNLSGIEFENSNITEWRLYASSSTNSSWVQLDQRDSEWINGKARYYLQDEEGRFNSFSLKSRETAGGVDDVKIGELDFIGNVAYRNPHIIAMHSEIGEISYISGVQNFDNLQSKAWLIRPNDGSEVILSTKLFNLPCNTDYVRIYDGEDSDSHFLGEYRSTNIPPDLASSGNALYIEFVTARNSTPEGAYGIEFEYSSTNYAESTYPWTQVNDTSFVLDGRLGINTPFVSDEFDLLVNGGLVADELVIESLANAPDYVFEEDYDLKTLEEVKRYIEENGHLPEVPSAAELEESGMSVSEMNLLLLKKIEELTLHLIELDEINRNKDDQIKALRQTLNTLKSRVKVLEQN